MQTLWEHRYAQRTQKMKSSAIRELLKLTEQPDIISFAGGLPAPELFPNIKVNEVCSQILNDHPGKALQYSTTEGYQPLREFIANQTSKKGFNVTADNILITSGSQQALDLLGRIFINEGDHILVECPTYLGALQAFTPYSPDYITVDSDDDGMMTDKLEEALRGGPKFIYTIPTFQNPTGITMSLERRKKLVELAYRYGVPIIEDDPYGRLRFEGEDLPTLVELSNQFCSEPGCYSGNTIYLSTFSKTLAPGLRLGWIIAPTQVIGKLVQAKQGADLHTSPFNQMIAYEIGRFGYIDEHVKDICEVYHQRRDIMLEELEKHMPAGIQWTHPQGGLFLWITLPEGNDTVELMKFAIEEKVAFVPGESFFPCGGGENTMRLNFSNASEENLRIGIERLGKVIKQHMAN